MKKLTICAVVALLTSSSAFAADNGVYLKAGVGGIMGEKMSQLKEADQRIKEENSDYAYVGTVGVGYQLMDNVRVEANGSLAAGIHYAGTKLNDDDLIKGNFKDKTTTATGLNITGLKGTINSYVDIANLGAAGKLYVGGGVGASYINGEVERQKTTEAISGDGNVGDDDYVAPKAAVTEDITTDYDYKLNFVYEVGAGLDYELSEGVNLDLGYKLESLGLPGSRAKDGNTKDGNTTSWQDEVSEVSPWVHSVNLGVRFSL